MSRSASHDVLFEPVQIGPRTLKNRLVGIPYSPGFGASKPLAHVAHRTVQAEGGWAAVFTGIVSPSESFEVDPHVDTLWDEDDERALAQQVKSIQGHGALAGVELGSAGGDAFNRNTRVPALAPSQLPSWRRLRVIPKEIEAGDIDRIQQELVRAARSALQAGCDIICVYGSFSYLPAQFLSPYFNRRTDRYGGSLENRARFWIEQLQAVRDAVGGEVAISSRIAAAGLSPIGISVDETAEFVRMADHLVDFWDVNLGALWARDSSSSRLFEEADQEEWTRQIKAASAKPVVAVGRYTDPDRMVAAIESGVCDLIGAARPRIADPFLPQKLEAGRYEDIRECTGANYCAATYHFGQPACIQNPTIGEEYRRGWHPERIPPLQNPERSFLVLGAGPAGMECALTLARRGARSVHLLDREPELGGFMRWATALPGLGQWARVVNWRQVQLRRHRRAVRQMLGTELDVAAVRDYGADVVILATGSRWAGDGQTFDARAAVPGADPALPHVLTPEQIAVEGKRPPGSRVVLYDGDGDYMGPALAQKLREEGYAVQILTPHPVLSPYADERNDGGYLRQRLHEQGIGQLTSTELLSIEAGGVVLASGFEERREQEADAVVLVTQRLSEDALYRELVADPAALAEAEIEAVYRIGDCLAPRDIGEAVFDGHRLAREIETEEPSVPLSPRREHLGAFVETDAWRTTLEPLPALGDLAAETER